MNTSVEVGFEILGIDAIVHQDTERLVDSTAQRVARHAKLSTVAKFMRLSEAEKNLTQQRHVLIKSRSRVRTQAIRILQMLAEAVEIAGCRRKHARHQIARISSTRFRTQHSRFRQQILELKEEFRRIVSRGMEGKCLGEDSLVGVAVGCDLEANFPRMKSKRETKGELKPLDAKFEPRQHRGRILGQSPLRLFLHHRGRMARRHRLQDPHASVFACLVVVLDRLRQLDDTFWRRLRARPTMRGHVQTIAQ